MSSNSTHTSASAKSLAIGKSVAVVGAGLSGTLTAALLAEMGFKVSVYEKRFEVPPTDEGGDKSSSEFGNATNAVKRSINLSLSERGLAALRRLGLVDEVMKTAIRMPKRVIHSLDGSQKLQAYGKEDQALLSVSRNGLNDLIKAYIHKNYCGNGQVEFFFGYSLTAIDRSGKCTITTSKGNEIVETFDLVIGADGAFSAVRENILKQGRINFQRKFIGHGYKELTIPPVYNTTTGQYDYALKDYEGLHIWPRGEFMLIALPNPDKSFTATLFAPFSGNYGFDTVNIKDERAILGYFQTHFPDALELMPNAVKDFQENPVGSLLTLRVDPWNFGKVVLIGDAAHAVVPFYGQGMNAAFQDGCLLCDIIAKELQEAKNSQKELNLTSAIAEFAKERTPATNALADMCLEHYHDMASNTASNLYLLHKKVESWIYHFFPDSFIPLYSMIAFNTIPYHIARERAEKQDKIVTRVAAVGLIGLSAATFYLSHRYWRNGGTIGSSFAHLFKPHN